ncbi:putative type I restriction enzymeP M protein [Limihaloglobus sulfuriphilus]|uniref:site-specific DNA-methyltransferase (adenine-specific) n=1 Tax=Limihaloglobus sulfuriphilus TaxID=1851148 RepID=A0A1R7T5V8_9BACT|nr:N-6 DNA methylase [Limihaloglobus sulfuriphilus]AQQ71856.1 putative type I restriction enzymeP M protein [Limihaloglobus sulfuriphilus]
MAKNKKTKNKRYNGQQSVNAAVKSICDIMRRSNCAGALQYVPELTWLLFLRILDEREHDEQRYCRAVGAEFTPSFEYPYRWQDWAAPNGKKRLELSESGMNKFFGFVNDELLPHLKELKNRPNASPRQKVISEILSGVEHVRIDTERNFQDVLDKVDEITTAAVDDTHVFTLSQVYEGLLLKMGEKGNDGGQFFTPREVIRAMAKAVEPVIGETVYDPCCGTGGFLAQSYEFMTGKDNKKINSPQQLDVLKHSTFYGREKENLIYPIALANLVLHGIDHPHLWHGNTLTGAAAYEGLFEHAPKQFDVILTNPPFGGKEGKDAQTRFAYKTGSTQVLFLQHIIDSLKNGGRCGMVLDEGLLFRTNETAFVQTKRKLLDECDLWCVVSLPGGVFTAAGAGVKTDLLFFTKGKPTEKIWYYDLSHLKIRKKSPLTQAHFEGFFRLLPGRKDSEYSWTVDITKLKAEAAKQAHPFQLHAAEHMHSAQNYTEKLKALKKQKPLDKDAIKETLAVIKDFEKKSREESQKAEQILNAVYDIKAVNPNIAPPPPPPPPAELIRLINKKSEEVNQAILELQKIS